jgi:hypothetical protein
VDFFTGKRLSLFSNAATNLSRFFCCKLTVILVLLVSQNVVDNCLSSASLAISLLLLLKELLIVEIPTDRCPSPPFASLLFHNI